MDFVFVIDEIATLLPGHDTSVALMEAAQARGARVLVTTASRLEYSDGGPVARCRSVSLRPACLVDGRWVADPDWYALSSEERVRLDDVDAVFLRTDPPVDANYLRATYLLDLVDTESTVMVNAPSGARAANEKLFALRVPELGPETIVTADRAQIRRTVASWGRAVLKPTDLMAGRGVLILDPADANLASILDGATDRGRAQVVVQRWVAASAEGDRRVIVLDGEPIGVIRRVAGAEDFRCNMAAGAAPVADSVTARDREICARLRPLLLEYGLPFVGIDVIGGLLTEVNVTSPTGVREIDAFTSSHLADDVIAWTERRRRELSKEA